MARRYCAKIDEQGKLLLTKKAAHYNTPLLVIGWCIAICKNSRVA